MENAEVSTTIPKNEYEFLKNYSEFMKTSMESTTRNAIHAYILGLCGTVERWVDDEKTIKDVYQIEDSPSNLPK